MAKLITQYKLLLSCPGDIINEIEIVRKSVEKFNELFSDTLGISIIVKHWSTSSYSQSGDKPQKLINKQFADDCDLAVALFWGRFGTPTDEYGSGTEEEINNMIKSGKQVFMYFSEKPISPKDIDSYEYSRVQQFKDQYKNQGIYFIYTDDSEFEKMFFAHLSQFFLKLNDREGQVLSSSKLVVKPLSNNAIIENIVVEDFSNRLKYSVESFYKTIINLAEKINGLHVVELFKQNDSPATLISTIEAFKGSKVEFDDEKKEIIIKCLEKLSIVIGNDFFSLGELRKPFALPSLYGTYKLEGTDDELLKYNLLNKLYETLITCSEWKPIENYFKSMKCISLVVGNEGTTFDEDIDITIIVSKDDFWLHTKFDDLSESSKEFLLDEYDIEELFSIKSTPNIFGYFHDAPISNTQSYVGPFGHSRNISEEFEEEIDRIFDYSVFEDKNNTIIKVHYDYIKHNSYIAFPTVLFVTDSFKNLKYEISSKNNPLIETGTISI